MSESDFGTFGRFAETPVSAMSDEMREAFDFTKRLRGLVPGPHRIWVSNPPLSKTIVPTGAYFQERSTLTKAEIEIVTILTTASWRNAYASYEHEKIGITQGHLDPLKAQRLIAGLPAGFEEPREAAVYELAYSLLQMRPMSSGLFRHAQASLGNAGIVDVAVLIGWFTMVSMTLAAFDVPANADTTALDQ